MQEEPLKNRMFSNDRSRDLVAKADKAFNPFYPLLILIGTLFFITACAYGVMTYRSMKMNIQDDRGLMRWMNEHGNMIFYIELTVLAIVLVATMATDRFWQRRADLAKKISQQDQPPRDSLSQSNQTNPKILEQ